MSTPQTFVLVHGSWHGGWCWRRVANVLRAAGHLVFTPTLTGLGERIHLLRPDLTIEHFATDLANLIEAEELKEIVLVGHSFGGCPISVVADRIPGALKQLVYLDSLVLEDGQSAFSRMDPELVAHRVKLAEETSGGLAMPPPPPAAFGVTEPLDVEWLSRRLTPHPLNSYQVPIRLNHPLGNGIRKTYIACTSPRYEGLLKTQEWIRRQSGWEYLEVRSGHDVMVTSPQALVEALISCL
jgi:pimeloyl-ACP methyl ester carboxylesterase